MKKNSETDLKNPKDEKVKTDLMDLQSYRFKKSKTPNKSQQDPHDKKNLESEKTDPSFKDQVIYMDSYKEKLEALHEEDTFVTQPGSLSDETKTFSTVFNTKNETESTETKNEKEKTEIVVLEDYKNKKNQTKWKKSIFISTAQVAGMTFLFLFMLMNILPNSKTKSTQAKAEKWFQAPANKSIIIRERNLASPTDKESNRTPDSFCVPEEKDPLKKMNQIDPKNRNCKIKKL